MATTIVTKNSSTAAAVPTAAQLVQGELAVNVADKRLYTEDSVGGIVELGTNPSAEIVANGGIALPDNGKATFGASDNLQIYSDGTNSFIQETAGAGSLIFNADFFTVQNTAGTETKLVAKDNAEVQLYYDNLVKLATTATGIDVTGTATTDGLSVDGNANISSSIHPLSLARSGDIAGHIELKTAGVVRSYLGSSSTALFTVANGVGANKLTLDLNGNLLASGVVAGTGATAAATLNAYSKTVSTNLPSALRVIENTGASSYWDIGSTGGASNNLNFYANANTTPKMTLTGAGNVGIGVTPLELLHIQSDTTSPAMLVKAGGQGGSTTPTAELILASGSLSSNDSACKVISYRIGDYSTAAVRTSGLKFQTTNANAPVTAMAIDNSGNVGIAGATGGPTYKLDGGFANQTWGWYLNSSYNAGFTYNTTERSLLISTKSAENIDHIKFATGSAATERMRISGAGHTTFGTTDLTPAYNSVNGTSILSDGRINHNAQSQAALTVGRTGTVGAIVDFRKSGVAVGSISVTASTTAYNTSSDQRLKENIADADDAGSKIDAIQVRQYDWKTDGSHQDYGMIAQELQTVAPEAVSGDADSEDMMGVDYSKLVPMLIKEIQSLRNRVAQLEG